MVISNVVMEYAWDHNMFVMEIQIVVVEQMN